MLTHTIVSKRVQPIPRWHAEVGELSRHVERFQFPEAATRNVPRYALRLAGPEEFFGRTVSESLDHLEVYCVT